MVLEARTSISEITDQPILEVEGLSVVRSGKLIIHDVDFTVREGEFVGIVGPNGSGKTTLLLSILGILKEDSGKIRIYGCEPMCKSNDGRISWVSQAASNLPRDLRLTVRELVELGTLNRSNMFSFARDKQQVDEAIEMVGLGDVQHTDIGRLSGGQCQRAVIARALASKADFIILDEPLVGIDRESRASLLKLLDDLCHYANKTILMVSHDMAARRLNSMVRQNYFQILPNLPCSEELVMFMTNLMAIICTLMRNQERFCDGYWRNCSGHYFANFGIYFTHGTR